MTSPTPAVNGSTAQPRRARLATAITTDREHPEMYHGYPVLEMHVDDPIPAPALPTRWAVRVYPDLARYLLTFNHPENRSQKPRYWRRYAEDMRRGLWRLHPHGPIFSRSGILQDGQNTLKAVEDYGGDVWLVIDFGQPDDIIFVIDRGAARTLADSLKMSGVQSYVAAAAAIPRWWQYQRLVGQRRSTSGYEVPSPEVARAIYNDASGAWDRAVVVGRHTYAALDKAWGPAYWVAGYAIIVAAGVPRAMVDDFFSEVADGSGRPGSATRTLADWARRRPARDTATGDPREPIELIIRAFNAWRAGKSLTKVRQPGFEWSRVKS